MIQCIVVVLLIPWLLCRTAEDIVLKQKQMTPQMQKTEPVREKSTEPPEMETVIPVLKGGTEAVEMPLETYLLGVVLGEMPVSFELEALKAQAVVARTYTMKRYAQSPKHLGGAVCTDPGCCQAYCAPEEYLEAGHTDEDIHRVIQAVEETKGQVLTYEDTLIDATYFSCSGGRTEAAVAVWGRDVPYLQSVDSPGEESARVFSQEETFNAERLSTALGIDIDGSPENWFSEIVYTEGGGVDTASVCGTTYKGTQLRSLLGLRSTAFDVASGADAVTITTRGYGHRVGMSQYGAQAMAETGSTYRQILSHYYPETQLENLSE